jgi:hypothetical protein
MMKILLEMIMILNGKTKNELSYCKNILIPTKEQIDMFKSVIGAEHIKKTTYIHFENLTDWISFQSEEYKERIYNRRMSMNIDDDEWSGVKSWEEYLELLNNGDKEVISLIKDTANKELDKLKHLYKDNFKGFKFDVEGELFDVGLVLTGEPECWLQPELVPEQKKRIDINIAGSFASGVDMIDVRKNGGKLIGIIKMLEEHDIEIRLVMYSFNYNVSASENSDKYTTNLHTSIVLKDYTENINYEKLSSLISPTFHRRGMFRVLEYTLGCDLAGNYGNPFKPTTGLVFLDDYKTIEKLEHKLFKEIK